MKIVVSAAQPTGSLHLGNYLGSIKNWIDLEAKYQCFFPIVDLHAITANTCSAKDLKANIYNTLALYLASGLDHKKSFIYKQSDISMHAELFWLLSCSTQIGKLNRMIQFKDKAGKNKEKASLGLYAYPVLMAADILLYKADLVPVGEDQKQHIELTNDIAKSFNSQYGVNYFSEVETLFSSESKRIMSLRDGQKKMSKSDESDNSRINLTDEDEVIRKKIAKAKTDVNPNLTGDLVNREELKNLLSIYSSLSKKTIIELQLEYQNCGFKKLKEDLAEICINKISPIREKAKILLNDKTYLDVILKDSASLVNEIASKNLKEIKDIIGF